MKRRLSASVDEELLAAAERAVREGRAPTVSALVEEALKARLAEDLRQRAREELVQWMHDEWGPLTDEERAAADASIERNTIRVRSSKTRRAADRDAA